MDMDMMPKSKYAIAISVIIKSSEVRQLTEANSHLIDQIKIQPLYVSYDIKEAQISSKMNTLLRA